MNSDFLVLFDKSSRQTSSLPGDEEGAMLRLLGTHLRCAYVSTAIYINLHINIQCVHFSISLVEVVLKTYNSLPKELKSLYGNDNNTSAWWKKPTRRFSAGKADTSIFRSKSRHVDFSLEKPTRRFSVEKADTSIFD